MTKAPIPVEDFLGSVELAWGPEGVIYQKPGTDPSGCQPFIDDLNALAEDIHKRRKGGEMATTVEAPVSDRVAGNAQLAHQQRLNTLDSELSDLLWGKESRQRWDMEIAARLVAIASIRRENEQEAGEDVSLCPKTANGKHAFAAAPDELVETCRHCHATVVTA